MPGPQSPPLCARCYHWGVHGRAHTLAIAKAVARGLFHLLTPAALKSRPIALRHYSICITINYTYSVLRSLLQVACCTPFSSACLLPMADGFYRGTSLIRPPTPPVGSYSSLLPSDLGWSQGGGCLLWAKSPCKSSPRSNLLVKTIQRRSEGYGPPPFPDIGGSRDNIQNM